MPTPARNPFEPPQQAEATRQQPSPGDDADTVEYVERVDKPWGHEEIVAVLEGSYVGKVLHIRAGAALSLQHHVDKDETISVQSGRITVDHGRRLGRLTRSTLRPGERLLLRARVIHRITADVDSVVLETSTARPGWRRDVVRHADAYGRQGTDGP